MTVYSAGDLVYYPATVAARVYLSLVDNNTATPSLTAPNYDAAAVYDPGDFVTSSSVVYKSIWPVGDNIGNTPVSSPLYWEAQVVYSSGTTYGLGDIRLFNDVIYKSLQAANLAHSPDASPTWWQILQPDLALGQWMLMDASLVPVVDPTPLYSGMTVYPLPSGFLRSAPQHPKDGLYTSMGAPTNARALDWQYEGQWILSRYVDTHVFRFVADVSDTTQFDPMFVEGLAARIAAEVCEPITQSTAKVDAIEKAYKRVMTEARAVNGVEVGAEQPPLDDFLAVRY